MAKIPTEEYGGWASYLSGIAPGLLFCIVAGILARWIDNNIVPAELFIVNYVLIAILFGMLYRNLFAYGFARLQEGIEFASRVCLFIGIVLLGSGLDLFRIMRIGANAVIMVAISITMCIAVCGYLGKRFGAGERWGHLVGAGIGVCGVSAIMALAPAIKAKKNEIVTAIGAALVTDILVLFLLPAIGHPLGFSDMLAGFIAGVVPSNTAQCIAIGYAYSEAAGPIATIVKSARNALMPFVVLIMTYLYTIRGLPVGEKARLSMLWTRFPKFIVGFLIASAFRTAGMLPDASVAAANSMSTWLFVTCFVGIGAGINVRELGRKDLSVISYGFLMTALLAIYVFLYSKLLLAL